MRRRILSSLGLAVSVSLVAVLTGAADETFTIDGDASALTLTANNAVRSVVVEAIAKRFNIEVVGKGLTDGAVNGKFTGDLGYVIKSVLPGDGYGIAYSKGQPIRITFSGAGSDEPLPEPPKYATAPDGSKLISTESKAPVAEAKPDPRTQTSFMEAGVQQQLLANKGVNAPPPQAFEGTMQEQIASAQKQALADLKRLTDSLKQAGQ